MINRRRSKKWKRKKELWELINLRRLFSLINLLDPDHLTEWLTRDRDRSRGSRSRDCSCLSSSTTNMRFSSLSTVIDDSRSRSRVLSRVFFRVFSRFRFRARSRSRSRLSAESIRRKTFWIFDATFSSWRIVISTFILSKFEDSRWIKALNSRVLLLIISSSSFLSSFLSCIAFFSCIFFASWEQSRVLEINDSSISNKELTTSTWWKELLSNLSIIKNKKSISEWKNYL